MSGDPEQEYFADGMVEEIITALSRIRWLFVIARNSSFTYKGQAVDVKQVGRELGVRYVLEGSVRTAGNRVRITEQLIDAGTGAHLWVDRFGWPRIPSVRSASRSSAAGIRNRRASQIWQAAAGRPYRVVQRQELNTGPQPVVIAGQGGACVARQALDGDDVGPFSLHRQHQTGADRGGRRPGSRDSHRDYRISTFR
jgi:hypothetical protein